MDFTDLYRLKKPLIIFKSVAKFNLQVENIINYEHSSLFRKIKTITRNNYFP